MRNRFNHLPAKNASRCDSVNVGILRGFDPHLTQFLRSFQLHLFAYVVMFFCTRRDGPPLRVSRRRRAVTGERDGMGVLQPWEFTVTGELMTMWMAQTCWLLRRVRRATERASRSMGRRAPSGLRSSATAPLERVGPFLHVSVGLATHDEAGGVFGAVLRAAALLARALLRFLAPFLARAFTSLTRLRCPAALC